LIVSNYERGEQLKTERPQKEKEKKEKKTHVDIKGRRRKKKGRTDGTSAGVI
jgi:hypothetical protein